MESGFEKTDKKMQQQKLSSRFRKRETRSN